MTDSGRRHTPTPPFHRVTLVGSRYAISAEDAKANNKNKKANNDKATANNDNMDNPNSAL